MKSYSNIFGIQESDFVCSFCSLDDDSSVNTERQSFLLGQRICGCPFPFWRHVCRIMRDSESDRFEPFCVHRSAGQMPSDAKLAAERSDLA
jgi:hypothetical protein